MGILLEEYDPCREALIEPFMVAPPIDGFPEIAVTCYSGKLLHRYLAERQAKVICTLDTEEEGIPVYEITENGMRFALYGSRVGAPACAGQLEEMIARGAEKFVMFGSCGVLDRTLGKWKVIIPTAAIRDEGVSYHYLPAAEEIAQPQECVEALKKAFDSLGEEYVQGKVWTTDALYRETKAKMQRRKEQGCIAVDMECASVQAVAAFRGVRLAQFFYAEDNLDEVVWDARGLSEGVTTEADRLFACALACAAEL